MTIWKFPIKTTDEQTVEMPEGAEVLTVQVQNLEPYLWAMVDPRRKKVHKRIYIFGTEHELPGDMENFKYLGTYQLLGGQLMFHVFVLEPKC